MAVGGVRHEGCTYATGVNPEAPPHPIRTVEKVKVEMTNLSDVNPKFPIVVVARDRRLVAQNLPNKAERRGIGKALVVVAGMWDLGREIQLRMCELLLSWARIGGGRAKSKTFSKSSGDMVTPVVVLCRPFSSSRTAYEGVSCLFSVAMVGFVYSG